MQILRLFRGRAHKSILLRLLYDLVRNRNLAVAYETFYNLYVARLWQVRRPFTRSFMSSKLAMRQYRSYGDYIKHQQSKYRHMAHRLQSSYDRRKQQFVDNFSASPEVTAGPILCLGARDGAEVDALRKLGFLAIGIDLVYPRNSSLVLYGDFNHIPFPDSSFKLIYTNCFDHIFDPQMVLDEVRRVLTPGGVFIIDLPSGVAGPYESFSWTSLDDLETMFMALKWSIVRKNALRSGGRYQVVITPDSNGRGLEP